MTPWLPRLHGRLRRSFEGDVWHGPSVLEALEGVSAAQAAAHPLDGVHSIWEIVLHLAGTYDLVLRRLHGDGRQMTDAEDWPLVPETTADNWTEAIIVLKRLNEDLRRAVAGFPEDRLDRQLVPEVPYSAYTQFIGMTQHNLYHAGQIVMLKKVLLGSRSA